MESNISYHFKGITKNHYELDLTVIPSKGAVEKYFKKVIAKAAKKCKVDKDVIEADVAKAKEHEKTKLNNGVPIPKKYNKFLNIFGSSPLTKVKSAEKAKNNVIIINHDLKEAKVKLDKTDKMLLTLTYYGEYWKDD